MFCFIETMAAADIRKRFQLNKTIFYFRKEFLEIIKALQKNLLFSINFLFLKNEHTLEE